MLGILSAAAYIPYWRLERSAIAEFHGGRAAGTRSVASYDQDTTTLGVEAARACLARTTDVDISNVTFATANPVYIEKTNATILHAALRLSATVGCFDAGGAVRSTFGAIFNAAKSTEPSLVVGSDVRSGLANSPDEANSGDAAGALVFGNGHGVIAEVLATASYTKEFMDRWRTPSDVRTKQWEERFTQGVYVEAGVSALSDALTSAGVRPSDVAHVCLSSHHQRAAAAVVKKMGFTVENSMTQLWSSIGYSGAADPIVGMTAALEQASPGDVIVVASLVDGADVIVLKATENVGPPASGSIATQLEYGNPSLPYAKFLQWKNLLTVNPPNRPLPDRASASAAYRSIDWKFGFVGSADKESGAVHMPPQRVGFDTGSLDNMDPIEMADAQGSVVTFTIDRLAYSPSPPVIFSVVDFDGGGRLPVELCDVGPSDVAVGDRVEMTFRRINDSDGIANYFYKARPVRGTH